MSGRALLAAVEECARRTGAVALSHYRTALRIESKADGSPVTAADREAELAGRNWINAHFPDDGVLGEEFGGSDGRSGRRWVIDPIDGTKSFIRGVPLWGSLIAVVEGEEVLAGAAAFPALGDLVSAAPGEGCWWNGTRTRVSDQADLGEATVLVTDDRAFRTPSQREGWSSLAADASVARTWGDCYGYLLLATGRAEVMVDPVVKPWDIAAFLPIVEEAGGVLTDLRGVRTAFGGTAIATNAALARTTRAFFASAAPDA